MIIRRTETRLCGVSMHIAETMGAAAASVVDRLNTADFVVGTRDDRIAQSLHNRAIDPFVSACGVLD